MARIQRLPWPTMNTPAHPAYTTYLAQRGRGDLAGAAETLKGVLKADPRADWAYNELVQLLWQSGRRADADTVVRAALRVNPLNAQAHNLFGTLLSELNDAHALSWDERLEQLNDPVPGRQRRSSCRDHAEAPVAPIRDVAIVLIGSPLSAEWVPKLGFSKSRYFHSS